MQFCANKLDKKDFFGKSDPFMVFYRSNEDGTWVGPLLLLLTGFFILAYQRQVAGSGHQRGREPRSRELELRSLELSGMRINSCRHGLEAKHGGKILSLGFFVEICLLGFWIPVDLPLQVHHLPQNWSGEEHAEPCVAALLHPCQSALQRRLWQVKWMMMYNKVFCTLAHAQMECDFPVEIKATQSFIMWCTYFKSGCVCQI